MKQSCEDIIFLCSESICSPLRTWVDRIRTQHSAHDATLQSPKPSISQEAFSQSAASNLQEEFYLSCERDLRSNVARMRLYLEDDRTVSVLLGHAMDRIVDEYAEFREVVWGMYEGKLRDVLFSVGGLREKLQLICEEKVVGSSVSS